MHADAVAADQGLLIGGGGVNMLDLKWRQNRVEDGLLVVELSPFPAESCVYMEQCYLLSGSTCAPKIIHAGAAGGSHLAAWPVAPGGTSLTW